MKEFYLTSLSDSSMHVFPNNKQCSFGVKLDTPINQTEEKWKVALVEIVTPTEMYKISVENINNYFHAQHALNVIEKARMKEICIGNESCTGIPLYIAKRSYKYPLHLL